MHKSTNGPSENSMASERIQDARFDRMLENSFAGCAIIAAFGMVYGRSANFSDWLHADLVVLVISVIGILAMHQAENARRRFIERI